MPSLGNSDPRGFLLMNGDSGNAKFVVKYWMYGCVTQIYFTLLQLKTLIS